MVCNSLVIQTLTRICSVFFSFLQLLGNRKLPSIGTNTWTVLNVRLARSALAFHHTYVWCHTENKVWCSRASKDNKSMVRYHTLVLHFSNPEPWDFHVLRFRPLITLPQQQLIPSHIDGSGATCLVSCRDEK